MVSPGRDESPPTAVGWFRGCASPAGRGEFLRGGLCREMRLPWTAQSSREMKKNMKKRDEIAAWHELCRAEAVLSSKLPWTTATSADSRHRTFPTGRSTHPARVTLRTDM